MKMNENMEVKHKYLDIAWTLWAISNNKIDFLDEILATAFKFFLIKLHTDRNLPKPSTLKNAVLKTI